MFGFGLFPDSVLNTAEQDINKYDSAGLAPGPGLGASQHCTWKGITDSGPMISERPREFHDSQNRISYGLSFLDPVIV